MRRILDIVKLSKVEACFLRLAFFLSKLPCFPCDIPGRCLGNVEIDDSGEVR